jgi:hypothetical protein
MAMADLLDKLGSGDGADNEMIDLAEREGVIDSEEAMLMRQMLKVEDEKSFNSSSCEETEKSKKPSHNSSLPNTTNNKKWWQFWK